MADFPDLCPALQHGLRSDKSRQILDHLNVLILIEHR